VKRIVIKEAHDSANDQNRGRLSEAGRAQRRGCEKNDGFDLSMPVLVVEDDDATALILQSLLRRSHRIRIKRPVDDPYELV
jgi:hypothetical protein